MSAVHDHEYPPPAVRVKTLLEEGEDALTGAFAIYPESETNFFLKINGAQLTFLKNDQGQVTAVIHHSARAGVPDAEAKKLKDLTE